MAYTNVWNDALPNGSEAANTISAIFRGLKTDIDQRFSDIFAIPDFTADPLRPYGLKFTDNADSIIYLGDNAGTPRSLIIKDKTGTTTYGTINASGFTGAVVGNASTATKLATARAIFGQNFDGSAAVSGNATVAKLLSTGVGIDLTKHLSLIKTSTTTSLVFTFTLGDSSGVWSTGHIDLSISSVGNAAPTNSAIYQIHFRFESGAAGVLATTKIGGESTYTVTLTFSGLDGTVTITIPDGGGSERAVAKCEVISATSVTNLA